MPTPNVKLSPVSAYLCANISTDAVTVALQEYRRRYKEQDEGSVVALETILMELDLVEDQAVAEALAEIYGYEVMRSHNIYLDPNLLARVSYDEACALEIIPVSFCNQHLCVAMVDPRNIHAMDYVREVFPDATKITPVVCTASELQHLLCMYDDAANKLDVYVQELEQAYSQGKIQPDSADIAQLIKAFLMEGVRLRASDIHFEPLAWYVQVRYRIDGVLEIRKLIHHTLWPFLRVRLKLMANVDIGDARRPQSGRFYHKLNAMVIEYRLSTHPVTTVERSWDENIAIRILDKYQQVLQLNQLGFLSEAQEQIHDLLQSPNGLILVTGPTGSGKTTTLYAMIQMLAANNLNIMTLEDPIEYHLPKLRQTEICPDIGLGYAEGIRSLLRQNPDVMLIGEIRDPETAAMVIRATTTGHRVLTTLHTQDVFSALQRMIDLGVDLNQLNGNLQGIVNQRLVRRVCSLCCEVVAVDLSMQHAWRLAPEIVEARGCNQCRQTGYQGRLGVLELLRITPSLQQQVFTSASYQQWKQAAEASGFKSLWHNAIALVNRRLTTLKEIQRVCSFDGDIHR